MSTPSAYQLEARRRWPDGMDMAWSGPIGDGRWVTIAWCAGLTVGLHKTEATALNALAAINQTSCGHGCWRDHELLDLDATEVRDAGREQLRTDLRVRHFEACLTCQGIYGGHAPEAARARFRLLTGEVDNL